MKCGACKNIGENYCSDCPYLIQKNYALNNWLTNMNYAYYLNMQKGNLLKHRNLMILDESHVLESVMINTATLKLTDRILKSYGVLEKLPRVNASDATKRDWLLVKIYEALRVQYLNIKQQINTYKSLKYTVETEKLISKYLHIERLLQIIFQIKKEIEDNQKIIIQSSGDRN